MTRSDVHGGEPDRESQLSVDDEMMRAAGQIAAEIVESGPRGWESLAASFHLTVDREAVDIVFTSAQGAVRVDPAETVLASVRRLREISARLEDGPWWRLLVWSSAGGEPEFGYDYGDEPFPDGQLSRPRTIAAIWMRTRGIGYRCWRRLHRSR